MLTHYFSVEKKLLHIKQIYLARLWFMLLITSLCLHTTDSKFELSYKLIALCICTSFVALFHLQAMSKLNWNISTL